MISEFWIIHNAICIYHKILVSEKESLSLDKQLFGGFFTALVDFSRNQFKQENEYLKDINLMNSSFSIVDVEKTLVIYRLFGHMEEKRYKQFVQPISAELINIINSREELAHLRLKQDKTSQKPVSLSLQNYEKIFEEELNEVLLEIQLNQHQLKIIDTLSLVQLKDEFQDLLIKLEDRNSIYFIEEKLKSCSEITQSIVRTKEFPLVSDDFLNIDAIQEDLIGLLEALFSYATKIPLKQNTVDNFILRFIKRNYRILKQFLLDEKFFNNFIVY